MAKRYQRGNQKPGIDGQTIQWPKDTKGVIRSRESKKDRQYNGQKKKDKITNNDIQDITQKTADWATQAPLKPGLITGALER